MRQPRVELPRDRRQYVLEEALKRGVRAVQRRDAEGVREAIRDAGALLEVWVMAAAPVPVRQRFVVRGKERQWREAHALGAETARTANGGL